MKKLVVLMFFMALTGKTFGIYNANLAGKVTHVVTYTDSTLVLFTLENQPASHPSCQSGYFALDATIASDIRHQLLSRLLTAYATGNPVNIGYDDAGGCSHGYIRVFRIG